jgi:TM2 domain-containing membrane protein YozV
MVDEDLGDILKNLDNATKDQVVSLKNEGNALYKQGRYADALDCYDKALLVEPNNQDVLNNKGLVLVKLGRIEDAKNIHKKIEELKNQTQFQPDIKPVTTTPTISPPGSSSSGFCRYCGSALKNKAVEICPSCGMRLKEPKNVITQEEKNPGIAALCSFFIPGLGQVYNGEVGKGIAILFGTLIGALFLLIPGIIVWIYGMYDAHNTAKKMNSGETPYRSTSTIGLILFAILGFILVIAFIIIGLAILAAFTFGMMGSTANSPSSIFTPSSVNNPTNIKNSGGSVAKVRSIAVTAQSSTNGMITITNNGGRDAGDLSFIVVSVNGVNSPTKLEIKPGSIITVQGTAGSKNHVIVTSTFKDGTQMVALDTYV